MAVRRSWHVPALPGQSVGTETRSGQRKPVSEVCVLYDLCNIQTVQKAELRRWQVGKLLTISMAATRTTSSALNLL